MLVSNFIAHQKCYCYSASQSLRFPWRSRCSGLLVNIAFVLDLHDLFTGFHIVLGVDLFGLPDATLYIWRFAVIPTVEIILPDLTFLGTSFGGCTLRKFRSGFAQLVDRMKAGLKRASRRESDLLPVNATLGVNDREE